MQVSTTKRVYKLKKKTRFIEFLQITESLQYHLKVFFSSDEYIKERQVEDIIKPLSSLSSRNGQFL